MISVSVSDLKIAPVDDKDPLPYLHFRIARTGSASVFGNLIATYEPKSGEKVIIGQIMRLAVYAPNKSRGVVMPLRIPEGHKLEGGRIHLTYNETEGDGGKQIAEAGLTLP